MTDTEILDALLALPKKFQGDTRGLREKPGVTQVILSSDDGMPLSRRFFSDRMTLIDALKEYHAQQKCYCPSVACPVHGLPPGAASGGW